MGSETNRETALETRIRLLRDIERSAAAKPDVHAAVLAAIHDLLTDAEAELGRDG
jgi:hypothetical protein